MGITNTKIKICRKKNNLFFNNEMMIQMNYEDAIMTGEDFILEESELATLPPAEYTVPVQVKQERASPYPAAGRRPGKKPARGGALPRTSDEQNRDTRGRSEAIGGRKAA